MTDPLFGKKTMRSTELEREFQSRLTELAVLLGWTVYSIPDSRRATVAGYPDLTLWNDRLGRFMLAELKRENGRLTKSQEVVIGELRRCGVTVHVWRPSDFDTVIIPVLKGTDE